MAPESEAALRLQVEQLEQKLEQLQRFSQDNEERVRTLISALPVGLLITDNVGKIEAANPQALSLFAGKKSSDFVNKEVGSLILIGETGKPLKIDESSATGKTFEAKALRFNGERFAVDVLVRKFSTKIKSQLLVVVEDVTQRHEVERQKQEFVSMISHDLRTPLTSIQFFLSAVGEGLYDERVDVLKTKARGVEADSSRLLGMINSLLDIDKLEAGKLDMFFDVIPIKEVIDASIQSVSFLAEQRQIRIEVLDFDSKMHVSADRDFIVQVMVNLLSNALKFSPKTSRIRIDCQCPANLVWISVIDQGAGISEKFLPRIFNRFEQAHISDARVKGGSGLGLASAKAIVEQHGGQIGVKSSPQGSTFWFTLKHVVL